MSESAMGQKMKTLSCHLCNTFGMEYRGGASREQHTKSKSHVFMKNFWENGLWPGPPHKANSQQMTPQIFSFHYENSSDPSKSRGLIFCRLCDEICLDAFGLYQHQSGTKHAKMLEKLKLTASHPILRLCSICNELIAVGQKFVAHVKMHENLFRQNLQKPSQFENSTTPIAAETPAPTSDDEEAEILPLLNLVLEKNLQENLENREVDLILEILSRRTKNPKTAFLIQHLLKSRSERRDRERQIQTLLQNVVHQQPQQQPPFSPNRHQSSMMDNQSIRNLLQILSGNYTSQNVFPAQSSSSSHFTDYVSRAEIADGDRGSAVLLPTKFVSVCSVSKEEIDRQMQKLLAKPSYDFVFDGEDVLRGSDDGNVDGRGDVGGGRDDDDLRFFMTSRARKSGSVAQMTTSKKWRKEEGIRKLSAVRATRTRLPRREHWSLEEEKSERLLTSSPVELPSASAAADVPALISDVSDQDEEEINLEYSGDRIDLFYNDSQNRGDYSNNDQNDDVVTLSGLEAISDDEEQQQPRESERSVRVTVDGDYSKRERRRSRSDDGGNKKRRGEWESKSKSVFDRLGGKLTVTVENDRR